MSPLVPGFETRVPAKWVLAGEHAVLRGARAVAMPHPELGLRLRFQPSPGTGQLRVTPAAADRVVRELIALSGLAALPEGELQIESAIPTGSGLGSSAALCVALSRWLAPALGTPDSGLLAAARSLEDRFHGRSSGMDVAVALAAQPIEFTMERGPRPLGLARLPRFTFHDTGLRAQTRACVEQVQALRNAQADREMDQASLQAIEGLQAYDAGDRAAGLRAVAQAMERARGCFEAWDLLPEPARRIEAELRARGALATKLTGAGRGGFVVALWADAIAE